MFRIVLLLLICTVGSPALADPIDDIKAEIFEEGKIEIKAGFRSCISNSDCTAVLSLCRWRPVNLRSQETVSRISSRVQLECKWPVPPQTPPKVFCEKQICTIPPDKKYY